MPQDAHGTSVVVLDEVNLPGRQLAIPIIQTHSSALAVQLQQLRLHKNLIVKLGKHCYQLLSQYAPILVNFSDIHPAEAHLQHPAERNLLALWRQHRQDVITDTQCHRISSHRSTGLSNCL